MPYVLIDEDKIKEFDPEGKLKTLPEDAEDKLERLERHANTLLSEKKELQLKFDEASLDHKKKLADLHKHGSSEGAEAAEAKLNDAISQIEEWKNKYTSLESDIHEKTLENKALEIASSLTKDTNRANLLKQQIRARIALDGDNVSVLDESGKPTISTVDELTAGMRERYPFLVDGSEASGGGAKGGSGGAVNTLKKFNEYSGEELKQIRADKPEVYDKLKNEFYETH